MCGGGPAALPQERGAGVSPRRGRGPARSVERQRGPWGRRGRERISGCPGGLSPAGLCSQALTHYSESCLVTRPEASDLQIISVNSVPVGQMPLELQPVWPLFSKYGRGSLVNPNAIAIKVSTSKTSTFFNLRKKRYLMTWRNKRVGRSRMQNIPYN